MQSKFLHFALNEYIFFREHDFVSTWSWSIIAICVQGTTEYLSSCSNSHRSRLQTQTTRGKARFLFTVSNTKHIAIYSVVLCAHFTLELPGSHFIRINFNVLKSLSEFLPQNIPLAPTTTPTPSRTHADISHPNSAGGERLPYPNSFYIYKI